MCVLGFRVVIVYRGLWVLGFRVVVVYKGLWGLGLGFRVQGSGLRHLALLVRVCRVKLFDHAFKIVRGQPDTVLKKKYLH